MIAFIWRKSEEIARAGTGHAFNVPDEFEGELVWEYVRAEGLDNRVTEFDGDNPKQLGYLGPCYICRDCQLVSFEWFPEFKDGRRTGHGTPTLTGTGEVVAGRLCAKCAAAKMSFKKCAS